MASSCVQRFEGEHRRTTTIFVLFSTDMYISCTVSLEEPCPMSSPKPQSLYLLAILAALLLGCDSETTPATQSRSIQTTGTSAAAPLTTAQDAARAAAALSLLVGQLDFGGTAINRSSGNTSASKARTEACQDGGRVRYDDPAFDGASVSLRADFMECRERGLLLDGVVTARCDNFRSDCRDGAASFGEPSRVLYFEESLSRSSGLLLGEVEFEGLADDASFTRIASRTSGSGRSEAAQGMIDFLLGDSGQAFVQTKTRGSSSLSISYDGPYALAANARDLDCNSGRATVSTVQPLSVSSDGQRITSSGELRFSNSLGEVASARWDDGDIIVTGADGSQLRLSPSQQSEFCALP